MKRFTRDAFMEADPQARDILCQNLAGLLRERLQNAPSFHDRVQELVDQLRALGHDLWSFGESDGYEAWCPNYAESSERRPGIVVSFWPDDVLVEWSWSRRADFLAPESA